MFKLEGQMDLLDLLVAVTELEAAWLVLVFGIGLTVQGETLMTSNIQTKVSV